MSLAGKRLLVTRPRAQAADLCDKLAALGAEPILFPTVEIAPLDNYAALDTAIAALADYHWLIFTSVNGVSAFWQRLDLERFKLPASLKIAAIGPATAHALEKHGTRAQLIPDEFVAEAILEKIGEVAGQRILLPRADIARKTLAVELGKRGAVVSEVAAYHTRPAAPDPRGLAELRRGVDAITFTSSSTVRNFVRLMSGSDQYIDPAHIRRMGPDGLPMPSLGRAIIACIGPITAQAARDADLPVDVMAQVYTMDGLVAALNDYFSRPALPLKENRWIPPRSL